MQVKFSKPGSKASSGRSVPMLGGGKPVHVGKQNAGYSGKFAKAGGVVKVGKQSAKPAKAC